MKMSKDLALRSRTIHLISHALGYGHGSHPPRLCTRDNFIFCLRHVRIDDELRYPDVMSTLACITQKSDRWAYCVVFPEPVSPTITMIWCLVNLAEALATHGFDSRRDLGRVLILTNL